MYRKLRVIPFLFVGCIFGIVASCTYPLDKKFVSPIVAPAETISGTINIQSPDFVDPYSLNWLTEFSVTTDFHYKPVRQVSVSVDGKAVDFKESTLGDLITFTLHPASYTNGTHTVDVSIIVDSQSGSLVNRLGGENYLFKKSFKIIVNSLVPNLTTPRTAIEGGYLTLRWDEPAMKNYLYEVQVYKTTNGFNQLVRRASSLALTKPVYVDSGYVGGSMTYVVAVSNYFGSIGTGFPIVRRRPADFAFQTDQNKAGRIAWTSSIPNAILTFVKTSGSTTIPLETGGVACDTVVLGDQRSYKLIVERKGYSSEAYDTIISTPSKKNFPSFFDLQLIPQQSKAVLITPIDMTRVSLPAFAREDSLSKYGANVFLPRAFVPSENGLLSSYFAGGTAILINPADFSQRHSFGAKLMAPNSNPAYAIPTAFGSESNTGLLAMNILYNGTPMAVIGDTNVDSDLHALQCIVWKDSANANVPVISADGQFMAINAISNMYASVYKNVAGVWTFSAKVSAGKLTFRGSGSTEIISIGSNALIYDASSVPGGDGFLPVVRTFNFPNASGSLVNRGYDPASQRFYQERLASNSVSTILTYGVQDLAFKGSAKAYTPPAAPYSLRHIFSGNYHFLSNGFAEKLQ